MKVFDKSEVEPEDIWGHYRNKAMNVKKAKEKAQEEVIPVDGIVVLGEGHYGLVHK